MLISTSLQLVFVANPKTASTSIEQVLAPYCDIKYLDPPQLKHMPLSEALQQHPQATDYFKFGVMRDPVEWIFSWYRYRIGNKVNNPLPKDMTFLEFWEKKDWTFISHIDQKKNLQKDRFYSETGAALADVILKYDRLSEGFQKICHALNMEGSLAQRNVSKNTTALDDAVSPDLQQAVRQFYQEDYALFHSLDDINARGFARLRQMHSANS